MQYLGELISLTVTVSWTVTALFGEAAGRRMGANALNLARMVFSLILLGTLLWIVTGSPYPTHADASTWFWMALSGVVGYAFGDFCLFNSYVIFGSRYGQLFMTLAPPVAGMAGWLFLGETLSWKSMVAMAVTLSGIAMSILVKGEKDSPAKLKLKLPVKGVLFGIGAGIGQGIGLVLSKIGLGHYAASLPADAPQSMTLMMPFAGTFIRAIIGGISFTIILAARKEMYTVKRAIHDSKALTLAGCTTLFGPFIGVSLSLMAVQFTKAGIASTLMALTPVLIILPYSIIYRQKISLKEIIGAFITVAGVALFFL